MKTFSDAIASLFEPNEAAIARERQKLADERSELEAVAQQYVVLQENLEAALKKVTLAKQYYDEQTDFDLGKAMRAWMVSLHSNVASVDALKELGAAKARSESFKAMQPSVFLELEKIAEPSRKALADFEAQNSKLLKKLRGLAKKDNELKASIQLPKDWYGGSDGQPGSVGQAVAKLFGKPTA